MKENEVREILKNSDLKITPQRLEILNYILSNNHASAQEIREHVSKKVSSVSFSTIYYTIDKLIDTGMIIPITLEPGVVRYDTNPDPHYHIICIKCGKITEVHIDPFEKFSLEELKKNGFEDILGFEIHFFGICKKCSKKV
ncbi:transcriptional repressor [bacterium]|nr:transcriptional repressor [bacterium]